MGSGIAPPTIRQLAPLGFTVPLLMGRSAKTTGHPHDRTHAVQRDVEAVLGEQLTRRGQQPLTVRQPGLREMIVVPMAMNLLGGAFSIPVIVHVRELGGSSTLTGLVLTGSGIGRLGHPPDADTRRRQQPAPDFLLRRSRNFASFLDLLDEVFVLEIDIETLHRRLDARRDEFGNQPEERALVLRLHRAHEDLPCGGVSIDAIRSVTEIVTRSCNMLRRAPHYQDCHLIVVTPPAR